MKRKNIQIRRYQGFSTIIITSTLSLLMALYVFSLLSVEMFNIKKVQNVVTAKQLKARANATLQCGTEIVMGTGGVIGPFDFSPCNEGSISLAQIGTSKKYKLTATSRDIRSDGESTASIIIQSSSSGGPTAAFASSGNISFNVSQTIDPYEGAKNGIGYDCSAIKTGGEIRLTNGADLVVRHPHDQHGQRKKIDNKPVECNASHRTVSPKGPSDYGKDIQQNIKNFDLFKENFNVVRDQWETALPLFDVTIPGATKTKKVTVGGETKKVEFSYVENCGSKIKKIIDANKKISNPKEKQRYIWVDGTCDLKGIGASQIATTDDAVTVVVKDGLLYSTENIYFHGNLYLFDFSMTDEQLLAAWEESGQGTYLPHTDLAKVPFYFRGSFITRGAFNLDSPGRDSHIFGSFQPGYSKGKVDYQDSRFGAPVILDGSWHDF
ncbi:hypothetical protein C9J01_29195 [Photobacterium rosenbergii]|uniref:Uncharacterized protein n=1 Tax=Photobacterium rosenbergii TaxID=294936 RepID=A0A2T3MU03_9GAMM|nr:hypothetical protein [Photobacterium rosenbergii]PSW02686.1 hypothetical protein C9J01_29195 [Photobacterium rosenbergii]